MNSQKLVCPVWVVVLFMGASSSALAVPVGPGAFGPGKVVESFEGLSFGANSPESIAYGNGFLVPGNIGPFTFGSGVTLVAPVPNLNDATLILIGDYALGSADWGLAGNGILSAANIPTGTAYMGSCCPDTTPAKFQLPSVVLRVGVYATDDPGATITLSAFDAGGTFLESATVGAVAVGSWKNNFVGIQNAAGIRFVTLQSTGGDANVPVFDNLTFEAVPEPSAGALVVMGIAVASLVRRASARKAFFS